VENGSYLRLKYFSIGYNLPKNLLEKIKVQGINIFISGNNIFTLTKYSGMNPDVSLFNSEAQNMGADFGGYPSSKLWSVGFKIGL
jgi:TonB-dependent starch-binding outer membrane protein SusC